MSNGINLTIKDRLTHHNGSINGRRIGSSQADVLLKGFRGFMNNSRKTVKEIIKCM
jgi:hypothetical protein